MQLLSPTASRLGSALAARARVGSGGFDGYASDGIQEDESKPLPAKTPKAGTLSRAPTAQVRKRK